MFRTLRPGGKYVLRVPHAIAGPLDVSQIFHFSESCGMHLKEYTYKEIMDMGADAGFCSADGYLLSPSPLRKFVRILRHPVCGRVITAYLVGVEKLACRLPRAMGKRIFTLLSLSKNVCVVLNKPT